MKFYFDGCSFTFGQGVPADKRWSNLVCKHFGAEEFNIASSGATNDTIMRHFFTGQTINESVPDMTFDLKDFDLFFIQFFQHYSTEIHTKYQEKVFEEINHTAITSHLKCLNKPYFLGHLGQSFGMTYDYDFRTPVDLLPCHHPSIEGNKVIAKKVIDIVEQKLL